MEQETNRGGQSLSEKIYRDKNVWVAAFVGGPLAAGYLIAKNFKTFGEAQKALTTYAIAVLATAGIIWLSLFAPYIERLPNFLFPLVYTGIAFVLTRLYQGEKILAHLRAGGRTHSWWRTLGVALIGLLVTLIPLVGTAALLDYVETANSAVKYYGTEQHEINYDRRNLTEGEVDAIAEAFGKTYFFDENGKWFVYAKKIDNNYEISVSVTKPTLTSPPDVEFFADLRDEMQVFFPNNKIIINLVVGDFDKVLKRFE